MKDLRAPHGRERGDIGRRKPRAREREKREGETPCRLSALSLLPSKSASLLITQGTFERAREREGKRERVSERGSESERERGREGVRERGREGERERGRERAENLPPWAELASRFSEPDQEQRKSFFTCRRGASCHWIESSIENES